MAKEKNKPNWDYEEAPAGTLNSDQLISYLSKNKIYLREEGDNICRFARTHKIKMYEVKREGQFGSNPHYFHPPSKSKIESILSKLKNNNTSFNGREMLKKKKFLINEIFNNGTDVDKLPKHLDDKVKNETERQKKLGEYREEQGLTKTSIAEKVYEKLGVKCNRKLVHSVLENKSQEMIRKKLKKIG